MLYEQCTYVCIYFCSSLTIEVKKKTVLDPSKTCPRDYEKLLSSPSGAHVSRTALWSHAAAIRSGRTAAAALEENNNNNMQLGRRAADDRDTNKHNNWSVRWTRPSTSNQTVPDLSNTINTNFIIDGNHIFSSVNPTNPSKSSQERIKRQKSNFIKYYT